MKAIRRIAGSLTAAAYLAGGGLPAVAEEERSETGSLLGRVQTVYPEWFKESFLEFADDVQEGLLLSREGQIREVLGVCRRPDRQRRIVILERSIGLGDLGHPDFQDVQVFPANQIQQEIQRAFESLEEHLQRVGRDVQVARQLGDRFALHDGERQFFLLHLLVFAGGGLVVLEFHRGSEVYHALSLPQHDRFLAGQVEQGGRLERAVTGIHEQVDLAEEDGR